MYYFLVFGYQMKHYLVFGHLMSNEVLFLVFDVLLFDV